MSIYTDPLITDPAPPIEEHMPDGACRITWAGFISRQFIVISELLAFYSILEQHMEKFNLAIGQIKPKLGDLKCNMERHLEFANEAKHGGAHLILFPELSLTGYSVRDLNAEVALRSAINFLML